ncbi:hypothetical protein ScPMuIL_009286 [Solemya velum]
MLASMSISKERMFEVVFLGILVYFFGRLPFLWSSITISTLVTVYIWYRLRSGCDPPVENRPEVKPPTTRDIINELYPRISREEEDQLVAAAVCKMVTYDAGRVRCLENFRPVKESTECVYAKTANVWGSPDWQDDLTLEENVFRALPTFLKFTMVCRSRALDGFLYEVPGKKYAYNIKSFGQSLRRVLKTLSDHDPAGFHCMDKSYIERTGWVFQFNSCTFFITTFAPFYPETNPRYTFGCENAYFLFQPEISFALHDLSPDSPITNWDCPLTNRDKIRVAYRDAGRPFTVPSTLCYPMAPDMVKPVNMGEPQYEWWKPEDLQ